LFPFLINFSDKFNASSVEQWLDHVGVVLSVSVVHFGGYLSFMANR
jgi:hypothetical protein